MATELVRKEGKKEGKVPGGSVRKEGKKKKEMPGGLMLDVNTTYFEVKPGIGLSLAVFSGDEEEVPAAYEYLTTGLVYRAEAMDGGRLAVLVSCGGLLMRLVDVPDALKAINVDMTVHVALQKL